MSYRLTVLNDNPVGFWTLEQGQTADLTGRTGPLVQTGSPVVVMPLAAGFSSAVQTSGSAYHTIPALPFSAGTLTDKPFSIEAIVHPEASTFLLSHGTDLLGIDSQVVRFIIAADGTSHVIDYNNSTNGSMHVVATYTPSGMVLFINGEEVNRKVFDVPPVTFVHGAAEPLIGGLGKATHQALAVYNYALSAEQVKKHYRAIGPSFVTQAVPTFSGGRIMPIDDVSSDVAFRYDFGDVDSWPEFTGTAVLEDQKVHGYVNELGQYVASNIEFGVPIDKVSTISDIKVSYKGTGTYTVQVSVSDGSWTNIPSDSNIAGISNPFNTASQFVKFRINFLDGLAGSVETLRVVAYGTPVFKNLYRTTTRTSPASPGPDEFDHYKRNASDALAINGTLTFSPDTDTAPTNVGSIEAWVYPVAALTLPTGTTYVDGVAASPVVGKWQLLHITKTPDNASIALTGNMLLGHVALYEATLSASEVAEIAGFYKGSRLVPVSETDGTTLTTESVTIYDLDWSIAQV